MSDQITIEDGVLLNVNVMLLDVGPIVIKRCAMLGNPARVIRKI